MISYLTLFGKIFIRIPKAALQAIAVPIPSRNLKRYDMPKKSPTLLMTGKKANRNPETPWTTAPMLKQVLAPIRAPYLPKIGLKSNS